MNLSYYSVLVSVLEQKDHQGIEEYIMSRENKINGFAEILRNISMVKNQ